MSDNRESMTPEDIAFHLRWRPSSGHRGGWRVTRQDYRRGFASYLQELETSNGRTLLFRTYEGAKRRADALNRASEVSE